MTKPPAIAAQNIGKDYGRFTALEDVSLHIDPGEFVTLLGPSGSGKTTFLMMLAGFEEITRGTLLLAGKDCTTAPAETRGFGMMFQGYALFPHMTVAENIAFPLKVQKWPRAKIRARVGEMIELVGLNGHEGKRPAALSGGQQQRVALARALANRPPVLLLDEPFSALDKNLRGQMQQELRQIHAQLGTTFVFVTHDQSEALALSDRVAIFDRGRLQQMADPLTVYNRPATRFVAEFLGDINYVEQNGKQVGLRPETLFLLPVGQISDQPCTVIECAVTDRIYMGAQSRLQLRSLATDAPLIMDIKTADLPSPLEPGQQIRVGWADNDRLIF